MKKKEYIDNVNYLPNNLTPELKKMLQTLFDKRKKAEIISEKTLYSNCYIEALKRKIKNPFKVKMIPVINRNTYIRRILFNKFELHTPIVAHCMWSDGDYDYELTNYNEHRHKGVTETKRRVKISPLIIHGVIKRYPVGYAKLQNRLFDKYYKLNNNGKKWFNLEKNTADVIRWKNIKMKEGVKHGKEK